MYEIVSGPVVWIGFIVFVVGVAYRFVSVGILAKKEKTVFPTYDMHYGLRSLLHWVVPFRSLNMKLHPVMTVVSFAFHICLLLTPLMVMGHAVMWHDALGISWWSLPPLVADVMTVVVVVGCAFFFVRRIARPEVRNVTRFADFFILIIVAAPFVTGFVAHQQWLPYKEIIVLHIIAGVLWLVAIPFTRLSHMLWFVFTRSFMGSEFGAVRNARDW